MHEFGSNDIKIPDSLNILNTSKNSNTTNGRSDAKSKKLRTNSNVNELEPASN